MILRGRSTTSCNSSEDAEEIELHYSKFTGVFGGKFTSTYGETAVIDGKLTQDAQNWLQQIKKLDQYQYIKALGKVAERFKECAERGKEYWPPTPLEFWAMGNVETHEEQRKSSYLKQNEQWLAYKHDRKQVAALTHSKEKAQTKCGQDYIDDMKAKLGMKK